MASSAVNKRSNAKSSAAAWMSPTRAYSWKRFLSLSACNALDGASILVINSFFGWVMYWTVSKATMGGESTGGHIAPRYSLRYSCASLMDWIGIDRRRHRLGFGPWSQRIV